MEMEMNDAITGLAYARKLELDFVTISQEPRATIARDLNEYLPQKSKKEMSCYSPRK